MDPHFAMGVFALYVVIVSLVRLSASREFPRLTAMKRAWGRSRGMLLHFLTNVALPMVLGIVFMSRGIVGTGAEPSAIEADLSSLRTTICALTAPATRPEPPHPELHTSGGLSSDAADHVSYWTGHDNLPVLPP